ncbi:TIR domain-containing protein [Novosphingobium sediminicola]|uniref:CD-NTase-associated protein 12/Pycsar effector protein TIR domain-containing protein n=1 Tax=Novosphingobium sediminicola TaxID=563162 RepID=A0A7W6CI73_9SPHN|nr:nucleotide-binding protein [Novosphingobium sediminicola]MBB3956297.1 hypothetical protein [Novosphingobium sediminicola]
MLIEDDEIRGVLLRQFHSLRHSNGGWVPISETLLAPHPVELRIIGGVCQQLSDVGLIDWKELSGNEGFEAGMAKITGKGVAAVERGSSPDISIRFPSSNGSALGNAAGEPKELIILENNDSKDSLVTEISTKVFVVHGRDDATKNEVSLFLRTVGLEPIILHMRPNGGRHLLTKFQEESSGAAFAVVLMTPDDEGGLAGATQMKPRARQNVVLELGFFLGKLGPANVAALMKDDVERPSDFDGIAYIPFDASGSWKTLLARELEYAHVPFDHGKLLTA